VWFAPAIAGRVLALDVDRLAHAMAISAAHALDSVNALMKNLQP
jgi:hypothetical protein